MDCLKNKNGNIFLNTFLSSSPDRFLTGTLKEGETEADVFEHDISKLLFNKNI